MCACSETTIKKDKVYIHIGTYDNHLCIDGYKYEEDDDKEKRDKMIEKIKSYTKSEIAEMIVSLVENGEEG
jgi:hypothetical protein